MRQAIMTSPGHIEHKNVSKPIPKEYEILIQVKSIGVCGSDIHVNHGKHPFTSYPVIQGHEFCGIIDKVGEKITGLNRGMKVTARPQVVCKKCDPCKRGDYNVCDNLKVEGFQKSGAAQDFFITTPEKLLVLPDNLSFEAGALVEPVSVAVHSSQRAKKIKNENVTIFGGGPIGNLIAQVITTMGAKKILVRDISDFRLNLIQQLGNFEISNPLNESMESAKERVFGNEGFSTAFEAVGIEATINDAIHSVNKGGEIILVGVFGEKPKVDLAILGDREINIISSMMYKHEDFEKAIDLISSNHINPLPLVTKHFPFEEYIDAYNYIDEQGDKTLKVIIDL